MSDDIILYIPIGARADVELHKLILDETRSDHKTTIITIPTKRVIII